jgi:hypothetical protein
MNGTLYSIERQRIGAELHDGLAQDLAGVSLLVSSVIGKTANAIGTFTKMHGMTAVSGRVLPLIGFRCPRITFPQGMGIRG